MVHFGFKSRRFRVSDPPTLNLDTATDKWVGWCTLLIPNRNVSIIGFPTEHRHSLLFVPVFTGRLVKTHHFCLKVNGVFLAGINARDYDQTDIWCAGDQTGLGWKADNSRIRLMNVESDRGWNHVQAHKI